MPKKTKKPEDVGSWAEETVAEATLHKYESQLARANRKLHEVKQQNTRLRKALQDAEEKVDVALSISDLPPPKPIRAPRRTKRRHATAVALASDWHVGERVDACTVNNLNAYDPDVARERAAQFAHSIDWMIRRQRVGGDKELGYSIDTLVLALLGDFIGGYIHKELMETNYLTPIEEIELAFDLIAGVIDYILDKTDLKRIVLPCVGGNHDRTTEKIHFGSQGRNSLAILLYRQLARHYRDDKRVEFDIAEGSMLLTSVYDMRIRWIHGHEVRYNGGTGGITIPLRKKVDRWNKSEWADLTCLGHFHQCVDLGYAVVNGSNKGYDGFAQAHGFEYEPPAQAFFLIDAEYGKRHFSPLLLGKDLRPRILATMPTMEE